MRKQIEACIEAVNQVILGKEQAVRLAMACCLARGHLLIEDLPGMGKSTLSHALAQVLGLSYQRIQFSADLLPSDILGYTKLDTDSGQLVFHSGAVFSEIVLADEINRAAPKTQSAVLAVIEDGQVTIDSVTQSAPEPFFVIASQNPVSQGVISSLSESHLDRFLLRLSLGYPSAKVERQLLQGNPRKALLENLAPLITRADLLAVQQQVSEVQANDAVLNYILRLVEATRTHAQLAFGLSPRGSMALLSAAKAWAFLAGRNEVLVEDIQAVFPFVAAHRLREQNSPSGTGSAAVIKSLLADVSPL